MRFDLHVHTNYSDGVYTPENLIDLAIANNLDGIAITDHDTVNGIEDALLYIKKIDKFKVIPGIEFSCVYNNEEVHILGYFIHFRDKNIIETTEILRNSRINRGIEMIKKINNLGFEIELEDVMVFSGERNIGRPHIGRAMVKKGYVKSVPEAFEKYLDRGKPAYVERYKISIKETINLIKSSGGLAVLAHPGLLKDQNIINYCISLGIDGIECIHSKHKEDQMNKYIEIAKLNNVFITGGSDFHGDKDVASPVLGEYWVDIRNIPEFRERI